MMIASYYDGRASALLYHFELYVVSFFVLNDCSFIACDYENKREALPFKEDGFKKECIHIRT